ncbi:hypothetical protein HYPSUDRAFT_208725 [Hypholoma sublateritium FD-334 SS-4]|uniref:Uncharacterized protein n=1 Tax=Hypholoma sublateritium (strain FD-334 SS-4) TaxID=945553 RepID=A0A0D2LTI8_HYPSF|nr:hypothetical protein HYPSUDRAFT_208970 [Hypholoma sublateritium FD-334 SS-4]KJA14418.1 hypothetical protein HYPSUDRAFT_208725 [Hypholoma sublateritium FD-334 SS-4]
MDNKPQGYDLDETNARGALNHSSLRIIEASELVLPLKGWYPGREYYIITKGLEVGVFLDMSEVRRSIGPFSSLMWVTCRTWRDAVAIWHAACQTNAVSILREGTIRDSSASAAATTSELRPHIGAPAARHLASDKPAALIPTPPTSTTSTPLLSNLDRHPPSVVVVSDSDSNSDGSYDDSSEVEATSPKVIERKVDRFDLSDDENGRPYLRQTYDAATGTYLGAPTRTKVPGQERAAPCNSTTALKCSKSCPPVVPVSGYKSSSAASIVHAQLPPSNSIQPATQFKRATKKSMRL